MTRSLAVKLMFERHQVEFISPEVRASHDIYISDSIIIQHINLDGEVSLFDIENEDVIYDIPCEDLSPKL